MRWCCEWDDDVDEMRWDGGSKNTQSSTVHLILRWDEIGLGLDGDKGSPKQTLK